jgi:hypothetical protein
MFLYIISQDTIGDYDSFDAAVVCAESEEDARSINPGSENNEDGDWVSVEDVKVELIGTALDGAVRGIVLSSFNAG